MTLRGMWIRHGLQSLMCVPLGLSLPLPSSVALDKFLGIPEWPWAFLSGGFLTWQTPSRSHCEGAVSPWYLSPHPEKGHQYQMLWSKGP